LKGPLDDEGQAVGTLVGVLPVARPGLGNGQRACGGCTGVGVDDPGVAYHTAILRHIGGLGGGGVVFGKRTLIGDIVNDASILVGLEDGSGVPGVGPGVVAVVNNAIGRNAVGVSAVGGAV